MATVLWLGDGGSHTGFARVTHAIGDRLVERGHDVHCLATNFKGDYWPTKVKMYVPNSLIKEDVYGRSRIVEMLAKVEPDVVVMLNDTQVILQLLFDNSYDTERYLLRYRPLLTYVPIDGHNHPAAWGHLANISKRIAMSRFGQQFMPEAPVVYHGIDSDVFHPVSEGPLTTSTGVVCRSKADCKAALGYPKDSFLVLRVDKNTGRKDYPASWKALLPVMKRHTDIITHFHCSGKQDIAGTDMRALWSRDPGTAARFFLPDYVTGALGWREQDLVVLYNAADMFLTTSRGEGFGLTIAEALSCGLPVVAQNVSAIPEIVGPGGILLEPEREITVPSGEDQWLADIGAFSEAIESMYLSRRKRRELGDAGRTHVASSFSWDYAADRFHDSISELADGVAHGEESDALLVKQ